MSDNTTEKRLVNRFPLSAGNRAFFRGGFDSDFGRLDKLCRKSLKTNKTQFPPRKIAPSKSPQSPDQVPLNRARSQPEVTHVYNRNTRARRDGRVAEGGGLLNRYRVKSSIEGSNPSLSAIQSKRRSFHDKTGKFNCGIPLECVRIG